MMAQRLCTATIHLLSKKRGNKITLGDMFDCSMTTLRHCREALKQWGYPTYSKKDMRKYYTVERM